MVLVKIYLYKPHIIIVILVFISKIILTLCFSLGMNWFGLQSVHAVDAVW